MYTDDIMESKEYNNIISKTRRELQRIYLSWTNDFLTIDRFSEYYDLSESEASALIDLGREVHENNVKMLKESL